MMTEHETDHELLLGRCHVNDSDSQCRMIESLTCIHLLLVGYHKS
jgi:hypothetical protein